jgi:hypothetical protein
MSIYLKGISYVCLGPSYLSHAPLAGGYQPCEM